MSVFGNYATIYKQYILINITIELQINYLGKFKLADLVGG